MPLWSPLVIVEVAGSVRCELEKLIWMPLGNFHEDQRYGFARRPAAAGNDGANTRPIVVFVRFNGREAV